MTAWKQFVQSAELELCGGHIFTNIQYYLTHAHYAHTVQSTYADRVLPTGKYEYLLI